MKTLKEQVKIVQEVLSKKENWQKESDEEYEARAEVTDEVTDIYKEDGFKAAKEYAFSMGYTATLKRFKGEIVLKLRRIKDAKH